MTPDRTDTEAQEEVGKTEACGCGVGRNTHTHREASAMFRDFARTRAHTKYEWNDCVRKRIMSSCLK